MAISKMANKQRETEAKRAAYQLTWGSGVPVPDKPRIGLVLGTGWGDALEIENPISTGFNEIPGFETLGELDGHARQVIYGKIAGKEVLALRGRVHLNEGHSEDIPKMVRLQTEMLFQLGIEKLIVTSAVGSLIPDFPVGSIAVIRSFITLFAPPMPMWAGEFVSPEDMLDQQMQWSAIEACEKACLFRGLAVHAMVRGPFFEGRKNDKGILKRLGAGVVGMSMLPEFCVAALYDVKSVGLGFVTNNDTEEHSHEENRARAKQSEAKLGAMLAGLIERI